MPSDYDSPDSGYYFSLTWSSALRFIALSAAALGLFLLNTVAWAAGSLSAEQATYEQDRQACMRGPAHQATSTCLIEARAALTEARRGRLGDADAGQYSANRVLRCNGLPAPDQEDCKRRMAGEGTTSGSVESGGILRELSRTVQP